MPPDVHALAERLKRDYERFSPAQQSLARYLADHLADVPLLLPSMRDRMGPPIVAKFTYAAADSGTLEDVQIR